MTRLSSKGTNFWKTLLPVLIFFVSVILSANMLINNTGPFYLFLIIGLVLIVYLQISVRKAKYIYHDNEYLYIENHPEDEKIPLTRILEITEFWLMPRTANIILKEPCCFGKKIKYVQRYKPFLFTSNHPDVIKLYEVLKMNARKELETAKKETGRIYKLFAD